MSGERLVTEALVLASHDYGESSQTGRLMTRSDGRLAVIAKGIRRPNAYLKGPLDHLHWAEVEIIRSPRKDLHILARYRVISGFRGLRRHYGPLVTGLFLTEVLRLGTRDDLPAPELFDLTRDALLRLEGTAPGEESWVATWFGLAFLLRSGVLPRFDACVQCDTDAPAQGPVRFAPACGGLLCRRCVQGQSVRLITLSRPEREWLGCLPGAASDEFASFEPPSAELRSRLWVLTGRLMEGLLERDLRARTFVPKAEERTTA